MIKAREAGSARSESGQSIVALILVLAIFVILPIGALVDEIARYQLGSQQLKACVDSASLAAACTNASSNSSSITTTQTNDETVAMNMFKMNSVLGQSLSTATQVSSTPMSPAANQCTVFIQFLDPTTMAPVALGSANGKILQLTASFGYVPMFSSILPVKGVFDITQTGNGGLPMLDVVLCFDMSASMDDFTDVSLVDRYKLNSTTNGYSIIAQGPLYTAVNCNSETGTPLNAGFPQQLDQGTGTSSTCSYKFSENYGSYRGAENNSAAPQSSTSYFTDLVVNLDNTSSFSTGYTTTANGLTYNFPDGNIGCLVEAARGNLESVTIATNAHVPYSSWGITPQAGYYSAYQTAATAALHPIGDAILAAQNFFTLMNNDADVHFGLVTFSTACGSSSTQTITESTFSNSSPHHIASTYTSSSDPTDPYTSAQYPPNPGIPLNPTAGPAYSNYSTCQTAVSNLVAIGGTNIAGALQAALNQELPASAGGQGLSRAGATLAIVLFTDGLPTDTSLGGTPAGDARSEAVVASNNGIPIYCVGLCMTPSLQSDQTAILTAASTSSSSGGIAGISGHGAQFFQVTNVSDLNIAFENVARSLCQLVK